MKRSLPFLAAACALALAPRAQAVDLSTRIFGVGGVTPIAHRELAPPAISMRFASSPRLLTSLQLGLSFAPDAVFNPGVRVDWVLIPETHMNVQLGATVSMDLRASDGVHAVDYRVGPGVELFFSEFPNLGLLIDFGLAGSIAAKDEVSPVARTDFSTFGATGFHYYF